MSRDFNYMLLDRLISDCKYYLGNGHNNEKKLWAGNVEEQISKMKELYKELDPKPDWTSKEEIETLAKLMRETKKGASTFEVNLYPQHGSLLETFITTAEDEEEALEIVVADLINKEDSRFFIEVGQIAYLAKMFGQDSDEYAEESGLLYVDATMKGADRPVYIDGLNLKIFEI